MVTRFGMDEKVGQRTYTPAPQPFLGLPKGDHGQAAETTTREIDVAVRDLLGKGFRPRARNLADAAGGSRRRRPVAAQTRDRDG